MVTTVALKKKFCGTELTVVQEGVPDAIPPEGYRLGWQVSLVLLAKLVEPEIRDDFRNNSGYSLIFTFCGD